MAAFERIAWASYDRIIGLARDASPPTAVSPRHRVVAKSPEGVPWIAASRASSVRGSQVVRVYRGGSFGRVPPSSTELRHYLPEVSAASSSARAPPLRAHWIRACGAGTPSPDPGRTGSWDSGSRHRAAPYRGGRP